MTSSESDKVSSEILERLSVRWQNSRLLVGLRPTRDERFRKDLWVEVFETSASNLETRFYYDPCEESANWAKSRGWRELRTIYAGVVGEEEIEVAESEDGKVNDATIGRIQDLYKICYNFECGKLKSLDNARAKANSLEHRSTPPEVRTTRTRNNGKRTRGEDGDANSQPQRAQKRAKTGGNGTALAHPKKPRRQTAKRSPPRSRPPPEFEYFNTHSDDSEHPPKREPSEWETSNAPGSTIAPVVDPPASDAGSREAENSASERTQDLAMGEAEDITSKQADQIPSSTHSDVLHDSASDIGGEGSQSEDPECVYPQSEDAGSGEGRDREVEGTDCAPSEQVDNSQREPADDDTPEPDDDRSGGTPSSVESTTAPVCPSMVPEDFLNPFNQCTTEDFECVIDAVERILGGRFKPTISTLDDMKREFRASPNLGSPWDTKAWREWSADRSSTLMKGLMDN